MTSRRDPFQCFSRSPLCAARCVIASAIFSHISLLPLRSRGVAGAKSVSKMDSALPSVVAMEDVPCVGSTEGAAAAPSDAGTVLAMEHEDPLLSFSSDEEEEDAAGQLALLAEVAEEEDGAGNSNRRISRMKGP